MYGQEMPDYGEEQEGVYYDQYGQEIMDQE